MTEADILDKYETEYGKVNKEAGYNTTVVKSRKGNFVVTLFYEPNSYKCEAVRQVTYSPDGTKLNQQ